MPFKLAPGSARSATERIKLRFFQNRDLKTLLKIDQECFPPGVSYNLEELSEFVRHPSSRTWVVEAEGAVGGFLIAHRDSPASAHIITIDVLEKWRRQGMGNLLMDVAENWAIRRGLRRMVLETSEQNSAAQRFYRARGYRHVRTIPHYYSDGSAAWVMTKDFDAAR